MWINKNSLSPLKWILISNQPSTCFIMNPGRLRY